jgi:hypothetical protein
MAAATELAEETGAGRPPPATATHTTAAAFLFSLSFPDLSHP